MRYPFVKSKFLVVLVVFVYWIGCTKDDPKSGDLTHIAYNPTSHTYFIPPGFPQLEYPADNPPTKEAIELGRKLFYDPILSGDSTMGCFSCHNQKFAFSDSTATSTGIDGLNGKRSTMSLIDIGFHYDFFFWDGRAVSLEDQALRPVEDPLELNTTWDVVEVRLRRSKFYPELFRKAFGITNISEINRDLATKAIAQFERTITSSGNSKYDRVLRGEDVFTSEEFEGHDMFFDINELLPDAECGHCHNVPLFTTNDFFNNGFLPDLGGNQFLDNGLGGVTKRESDNGKFKAPTLRNILYSAPYMHDGTLKTLDEVLKHYNDGGHPSFNRDPLVKGLHLNPDQLNALKAFILTLSDEGPLVNPAYSNPF